MPGALAELLTVFTVSKHFMFNVRVADILKMTFEVADWRNLFANIKRDRDLVDGYIRFIERMADRGLPPIFEPRHLSRLIGITERSLARIVHETEDHYRSFSFPKRRGGFRTISSPNPSLKAAQDWILEEILCAVPVHERAFGFVKGRSVVDNARAHLGSRVVLRIDLQDFFGSIKFKRILSFFSDLGYPPNVSYNLSRICTLNDKLPQGGSTSPALSNIVCRRFDEQISEYAVKEGLIYTRYADDISISGESVHISPHLDEVRKIALLNDFSINEAKTLLSGSDRKVIITGVSISGGRASLPRTQVRRVKADAHLILKYGAVGAMQQRGEMDPFFVDRVLGRIAFWLQIDPGHPVPLRLRKLLLEQRRG